MTTDPMRVSYWTELYWPSIGGIEVFSRAFLPRLKRRGYDVSVITSSWPGGPPDVEVVDGIEVRRLPLREALEKQDLDLLAETFQRLQSITQSYQPDLIHLNFSGPLAFFALRIAAALNIPLLLTIHISVSELRGGQGTLLEQLLAKADWIVANSYASLDDIGGVLPTSLDRVSVIYHGLEVPALISAHMPDPPTLLCIGRLVHVKGFDLAITALKEVQKVVPGVRMLVAGDGNVRADLEVQVKEMGLTDAVEFLGHVDPDKVPGLMASATLVIMPSRWRESFGLVAIEAAFQERVVVGSRVGGIQETVKDGKTGVLVENESADAIAEAVINLLGDRHRLEEMGQAARDRAIRLFSIDESVDQYDDLYRRLDLEPR